MHTSREPSQIKLKRKKRSGAAVDSESAAASSHSAHAEEWKQKLVTAKDFLASGLISEVEFNRARAEALTAMGFSSMLHSPEVGSNEDNFARELREKIRRDEERLRVVQEKLREEEERLSQLRSRGSAPEPAKQKPAAHESTRVSAAEFAQTTWNYWRAGRADLVPAMQRTKRTRYATRMTLPVFQEEMLTTACAFLDQNDQVSLPLESWIAGEPWNPSLNHAYFLTNYRLLLTHPKFICLPLGMIREYAFESPSLFRIEPGKGPTLYQLRIETLQACLRISSHEIGSHLFPTTQVVAAILSRAEWHSLHKAQLAALDRQATPY